KRKGGVAVVQDPSTALFPGMPRSAIEHVSPDYVIPLEKVADVISTLASTERASKLVEEPMERTLLEIKCPECTGPLWEERQGNIVEYRCRIGHAYTPLSLKEEQKESVERALWESVIALQDAAEIARRLQGEQEPASGEDAKEKSAKAQAIKNML